MYKEPEFTPTLETDHKTLLEKEIGMTPEALLALGFEERRNALEKIGVHLEKPKAPAAFGPTKMYYQE